MLKIQKQLVLNIKTESITTKFYSEISKIFLGFSRQRLSELGKNHNGLIESGDTT